MLAAFPIARGWSGSQDRALARAVDSGAYLWEHGTECRDAAMLKLSMIFATLIIAHSVDASVTHGQYANATIRLVLSVMHSMLG
jgi:hypothetical protein